MGRKGKNSDAATGFLLDYADWLAAHLEDWTVTNRGGLVQGKPRHYIRITPADPRQPVAAANPDETEINIANGGGKHPARNIVGGDFLHLVRLGIRDAHDPLIVDSIAVIDQVIKRDLPQGPCWRRYNHDGYGDKPDGGAFDGTGVTETDIGLRLRYEIAREIAPYIGVSWLKKYGETARISRQEGETTDTVAFVVGLRLWW